MKKYLLFAISILMLASCSPTEVESVEPVEEPVHVLKPTPKPGDNSGNGNGGGNNGGGSGSGKDSPSEENDFNNNRFWLLFKEGKYELLNTETDERHLFDIISAERNLRMGTIWEVPKDAPYLFTHERGLWMDRDRLRKG